jgi:hypothetical protein
MLSPSREELRYPPSITARVAGPQPEIDLTFSVDGGRYRSLLKTDPKSRQMESYLFNGDGKLLTNGKKEPFEEIQGRRVVFRWSNAVLKPDLAIMPQRKGSHS